MFHHVPGVGHEQEGYAAEDDEDKEDKKDEEDGPADVILESGGRDAEVVVIEAAARRVTAAVVGTETLADVRHVDDRQDLVKT